MIEAQLAHAMRDSLGRAYNRTEFEVHRRLLMQTWADYLDKLRKGGAVLNMSKRAARRPYLLEPPARNVLEAGVHRGIDGVQGKRFGLGDRTCGYAPPTPVQHKAHRDGLPTRLN